MKMVFKWIICVLLSSVLVQASRDVCESSDESVLASAVHAWSTPAGGVAAGVYTKDTAAAGLEDCIVSCCEDASCNVVFYHQQLCYLIACNTTSPRACDPARRSGSKFATTYMVEVRPVDPLSTQPKHHTTAPQDVLLGNLPGDSQEPLGDLPEGLDSDALGSLLGSLSLSSECSPAGDGDKGCTEPHTECRLVLKDDTLGYMCQCVEPYVAHPLTGQCTAENSTVTEDRTIAEDSTSAEDSTFIDDSSSHAKNTTDNSTEAAMDFSVAESSTSAPLLDTPSVRPERLSCEAGLSDECQRHEECVATNSRSRGGVCTCVSGYARDERTGWCRKLSTHTETTAKHLTTTPSMTITATEKPLNRDSLDDKGAGGNKSASTDTAPTKPPALQPLTVSAGDSHVVQLPDDSVTLFANVLPKDENNEYTYLWTLVSHPEGENIGQMQNINSPTLLLNQLVQGLYTFKIAVSAEGKYGEAFTNVTVTPPARSNTPPVAVVKPPAQKVSEPNDVVIDGSESTDDDSIVKYVWEQVSGPVSSKHLEEQDLTKTMLVLKGMGPGDYRFKLTVTDSDNVENSTFANVTVIKELDYPPKANAGSNVIISLPQNAVKLYGNASTDDKGIASYEWIKNSDDKLTADMTGVRSEVLELSNLEEGDYTFTLKVTDTAGQTDTADVNVFVRPELNKPPVANAGRNRDVLLPVESVTLDGSNSTDDQKIDKWLWTQVSGPSSVVLDNADRSVATVTKLVPGEFVFKLTVTDNMGQQAVATVTLTAKQNENAAPVARAGGDRLVRLPAPLVVFNGSGSTDDRGIVQYKWTRRDKSLAAGDVLNGSDHQAVLQLANVVAGRYVFSLDVFDAEGLTSSDTASLIVKPDEHENDLVELTLASDISSFTESNRQGLESQLGLLLHTMDSEVKVHIQHLSGDRTHGQLTVRFFVTSEPGSAAGSAVTYLDGPDVVAVLKKKLHSEDVLDFRVLGVDTVVCQLNCSGHGVCDQATKRCICEAFWMENIIDYLLLDRDSNCDWSILYVIIVAFLAIVVLAGVVWGAICLCRSPSLCCRLLQRDRKSKRHRYQLLNELDHGDTDNMEMLPKGKLQSSSLMVSESDFSSDEETLFVNHRKTNGHVKNGVLKTKAKVKT